MAWNRALSARAQTIRITIPQNFDKTGIAFCFLVAGAFAQSPVRFLFLNRLLCDPPLRPAVSSIASPSDSTPYAASVPGELNCASASPFSTRVSLPRRDDADLHPITAQLVTKLHSTGSLPPLLTSSNLFGRSFPPAKRPRPYSPVGFVRPKNGTNEPKLPSRLPGEPATCPAARPEGGPGQLRRSWTKCRLPRCPQVMPWRWRPGAPGE